MNIKPLISVIIPTFNRKFYLNKTLQSILSQSFKNFEIIVVSDGSSDGTNEMVNKIKDNRVRLVKQKNSGQPANPRNHGIRKSLGEYIAFCDDDDIWEIDKLNIQYNLLKKYKGIDLCYSNASCLIDNIKTSKALVRRRVFKNHFRELLFGNFIPNSTIFFRRSLIDSAGFLNEDSKYRGIEDYEFLLRAAYQSSFYYIDEKLMAYRIHSNNITFSRSKETLRAIKVVRDISQIIKINHIYLLLGLIAQYCKYITYKILFR